MATNRTIEIPESVFFSAETLDDLEDWLAANNPKFIAEMRRIRDEEAIPGKGKDISEILKRWPIKS
ncbi:MAG: hypothetical protein ACE15C_11030 [Phycisphaerae bacterium]